MSKDGLIAALKIANPTRDSKGRSKYGMGMKTAACWIGNKWRIETAELTGGEEWNAEIDVDKIAAGDPKVPLTMKEVSKDAHYTRITITDLNRNIQSRTDETIKAYLSSIYRFDLQAGRLKIIYRDDEILPPPEDNFDTDMDGKPMKLPFETEIGGKTVKGFIGVLKQGAGGRKFAGFSLYQNDRQIKGFPTAWKPSNIYGGINDEGANNLVSQRLMGIIELDPNFNVSHTKDAVLYSGNEEEELEDYLFDLTKDYQEFANKRRGADRDPIRREKFKEMVADLKTEFVNDELRGRDQHIGSAAAGDDRCQQRKAGRKRDRGGEGRVVANHGRLTGRRCGGVLHRDAQPEALARPPSPSRPSLHYAGAGRVPRRRGSAMSSTGSWFCSSCALRSLSRPWLP